MKTPPFIWVTRILLFYYIYTNTWWIRVGSDTTTTMTQGFLKGFKATPNPSVSSFQPLLTDSTGNYSLGFLRVNRTQLALAVLHVKSSEPFWIANTTRLPRWSDPTHLLFNGSLVISDTHTGVFWSSDTDGDRVWISNTSNLEIQNSSRSILWQSFDFPSNTLVENQNFTSTMSLVSSNGLYSMKLGFDFIGLYAKFKPDSDPGQIYLKHTALEAKASVIEGQGPIYALLHPDGFLGMYQNGSVPVDVQSFKSFQQPGSGNRRIRLEPDGNLKGYYWTGSNWVLDYQAIPEPCELPSPCGSYGLCQAGKGKSCSCIDNRTEYTSGRCPSPGNTNSGDLCGAHDSKYRVMRRSGVELPFKELMEYEKTDSLDECESTCEKNCTCWGAVYANSSGFCYRINYPIQTLLGVGDETKVGYFKVREGAGKGRVGVWWFGVVVGSISGAMLIVGMWWCRMRRRRKGVINGYVEEESGVNVGPYKDLGSASFRSIQLSER